VKATDHDLYIFDLDDTLAPRGRDYLLEYRADVLIALAMHNPKARWAIATNQGGVGLRHWMEMDGRGDPGKYPTEEQVRHRLMGVCHLIENAVRYATDERGRRLWLTKPEIIPLAAFAYYDSKAQAWGPQPEEAWGKDSWRHDWRKPMPGMLRKAVELTGSRKPLMVGDRNEDRNAAENAGIDFVEAWKFFSLKTWTQIVEGQ